MSLTLSEKMPRPNAAVAECMLLGGAWTLAEISARTHLSENTVSTRISENQRKYGLAYGSRKTGVGRTREYFLLPSGGQLDLLRSLSE